MSMLSERSTQIVGSLSWLGPNGVSTVLARWVIQLLPKDPARQKRLVKAAALVGVRRGDDVCMGQVSYVQKDAGIVAFRIMDPDAAIAFTEFGRECCMTSRASILRTCIMLGLGLPRIEKGVMSKTRDEAITPEEYYRILDHARELFPKEKL